jgi:uncharacterized membrane protein YcaP (DUF421 family)
MIPQLSGGLLANLQIIQTSFWQEFRTTGNMEWSTLFGEGKELSALQMSVRAFLMFFIALILIRLSGMRTFGKNSAFDIIIGITLGAVLSRGIVGASAFGSVVAAASVMAILHRILGWLSVKYSSIDDIIKGESRVLYKNGEVQWKKLERSSISINELRESVRQEINEDSFDNVDRIYIDSSGKISVVRKSGAEKGSRTDIA